MLICRSPPWGLWVDKKLGPPATLRATTVFQSRLSHKGLAKNTILIPKCELKRQTWHILNPSQSVCPCYTSVWLPACLTREEQSQPLLQQPLQLEPPIRSQNGSKTITSNKSTIVLLILSELQFGAVQTPSSYLKPNCQLKGKCMWEMFRNSNPRSLW